MQQHQRQERSAPKADAGGAMAAAFAKLKK
jgi:hypothetical protein